MPRALSLREIVDELDLIKIKKFCFAKGNVKRMIRETIDR
jgi:hypothetical protein